MKKQLISLLILAMAIPALAQETNNFYKGRGEGRGENWKNRERSERPDHSDWTEDQHRQHEERKYQFMDKALTQIGVSDEDKIKIRLLQETHRQKMKENMELTTAAREKLSALQDAGASESEIYAAIDEVTGAQAAQLKILVRNRMEMEKILGKEKNAKFIENARTQFRRYGRRGGSGFPPRPGVPPKPSKDNGVKNPPNPKTPPEQVAPPPPQN